MSKQHSLPTERQYTVDEVYNMDRIAKCCDDGDINDVLKRMDEVEQYRQYGTDYLIICYGIEEKLQS